MDDQPKINLEMTPKEIGDLDELCGAAISMGGSLGWHTYVVKKLLFQLLRRLPADKKVTFTTDKISGREPDGYLYLDEPTEPKNEGE